METNWLSYCFIDYSDFLIANSPYSLSGKNSSEFLDFGSIGRPKALNFWGSEHSPNYQFLRAILTGWRYVFHVALSQINNTDEQNCSYFNPWRLTIAMLTVWCYVFDVVFSQIKKDRRARLFLFQSLKVIN